jgi:translation initiation factor IF-2
VRVVREGSIVYEGSIASLKRFRDDARSVREGFECGVGVENFNDLKEGDVLEFFETIEVTR